jgi:hypothetical protein
VAQLKYLGTAVTNQTWFRRKLRGDWIRVTLAAIQPRNFVFSSAVYKRKN